MLPYGRHEIPLSPKLPTPELLLDLGRTGKPLPGGQTFPRLDTLRGTVRRDRLHQKLPMIPLRPHLQATHLVSLGDLSTDVTDYLIDLLPTDPPPILHRTHHRIEQHRNIVTFVEILAFCPSPPLPKKPERSKLRGISPVASEVESSRHILWQDEWRRIDEVARELRQQHPESFRKVSVRCRNREQKEFWAFSKSVRLKRYGRKRIVIVHERSDLTDDPRFLVTDALHWESGRIIETWSFRWAAEVFHEFSKQGTRLEAAQVRNEEAVTRHLRLSCLAQSILQRMPTIASTSEQFAFAKGATTFGQRCRAITREVFHSLLVFAQRLFAGGYSYAQVTEALMPA